MDRFAVFLWWSLRALHGKSPNTLMMCFSECCGGESHLRLPQSSGNQQTRYCSAYNVTQIFIHAMIYNTLIDLQGTHLPYFCCMAMWWSHRHIICIKYAYGCSKLSWSVLSLINIIFLFFLYLHQSKWTKGTRSISCALWAEADGGLLDWCWYTSCGRTEGRWHVYYRQSTDLRTEYTRCRQTTGWVCFYATLTIILFFQ